jgi:hypothetical protein
MSILSSEACLYAAEVDQTLERLSTAAAMHRIEQNTENGDRSLMFNGGKVMLRADQGKLLLRVETTEILLRVAIEDILATHLSRIQADLPDPICWIPGSREQFAAISTVEALHQ